MKTPLSKTKVLSDIKKLTGLLTDEHNDKLSFIIDMIVAEVKDFVNYNDAEELPQRLEPILTAIVWEFLKYESMSIGQLEKSRVKSIQRGDTKIDYALGAVLATASRFGHLSSQIGILRRYKKVTMR